MSGPPKPFLAMPAMRPSGVPFQDMCTMIGLLTVTWGWVDNTLAMAIGLIQENAGPIQGHPESPVSLKKKMAFLRTALRDVVRLHPFQKEGAALLESLKHLSVRRNNLVHSASWQTPEGRFQAVSFKVIAGKYAGKDHGFDIHDAVALNGEIGVLSDKMTAFMLTVAHAVC